MESKPRALGNRVRGILGGTSISLCVLLGCGSPGLPTQPPGTDAANPDAKIQDAEPAQDPFASSAFEGESLEKGGHHGHHGHHNASPEPSERGGAK